LLTLACNILSPRTPPAEPSATIIATSTATPHPTATPAAVPTRAPQLGDTWTRPADGMTMVYVPAGEFLMGSNDGAADEKPMHTVALDAFWMDQTEVTNAQYRKCAEVGKCAALLTCDWGEPTYNDGTKSQHPAVCELARCSSLL
jgi:formylglycine-generating enzyme required for sulfatase activity